MPSPQDMRRALAALELSIQLFNLKSDFIAAKTPESLRAAFDGAIKLEQRLQAWPGTLSPDWQPRIVFTSDPVIRERYLYASSWIRRTWGYWRQYRIMVNQAIFRYTTSPRQKQLALYKIRQSSREICASTDDIIDGKGNFSFKYPNGRGALSWQNSLTVPTSDTRTLYISTIIRCGNRKPQP